MPPFFRMSCAWPMSSLMQALDHIRGLAAGRHRLGLKPVADEIEHRRQHLIFICEVAINR